MTISKLKFNRQIGLISLFAGSMSLMATSAIASEPAQKIITQSSPVAQTTMPLSPASAQPSLQMSQIPSVAQLSEGSTRPMAQVTSVSQLSDVRPTDWAFQALQSLVERYGCIAGYPDRTYRGNRAMTRYEFAAGLNACLDRVNELIAASTADLVKKEDLATLQKLQEQFAAELATLRGRVDALEARTTTLEKQQFSTTTKLVGEAIFSVANAYTTAAGVRDGNVVLNDRVRLNLQTSFSGKDLLITGLQAQNFGASGLVGSGSNLGGVLGLADPVFGSASNLNLAYQPQFPTVDPSTLTGKGAGNGITLYKLLYIFPVAKKLTAFAGTNAEVSDAFPSILPWASEGQGALSRFSSLPAAQRISGGTSQTGLAAAAGLIFNISDAIDFRALYGSVNANLPSNFGLGGIFTGNPVTPLGAGIGGGSYVVAGQLTVKPSPALNIGLNYSNSYHQLNVLATGLSNSDINSIVLPGSSPFLAGFTVPTFAASLNNGIRLNTVGASASFRLTPGITIAGSYSYIFANLVDVGARTNFDTWLVGVQFSDILKKGNTAGIIFGQPLKRVLTAGAAINPENAVPYQLEGFFNFRVNDNLSITPGAFAVFNPEGRRQNGTAIVPVIRTTFSF